MLLFDSSSSRAAVNLQQTLNFWHLNTLAGHLVRMKRLNADCFLVQTPSRPSLSAMQLFHKILEHNSHDLDAHKQCIYFQVTLHAKCCKLITPCSCAGDGVLQDTLNACLQASMLQESDPIVVVQQMVHRFDAWVSHHASVWSCGPCHMVTAAQAVSSIQHPFEPKFCPGT